MRYRLVLNRPKRRKRPTTGRLARVSSTTLPAQRSVRGAVTATRANTPSRAPEAPERASSTSATLPLEQRVRVATVVSESGGLRVYDVVEPATRRRLTLTTLSLVGARDWGAWDRLSQECRVLRGLRHPAVHRYVDHGEEDGKLFLLTERVEGRSLQVRLDAHERYSDAKLELIVTRGLEVLHDLHALNPPLFHCDIAPASIVISDHGRLTLTRFGRARGLLDDDSVAGDYAGRLGYAAPEWGRRVVGAGTDLYAFGATVIAIASGRDAASLPTQATGIDIDACMKHSALRETLRDLVHADPAVRVRASLRWRERHLR